MDFPERLRDWYIANPVAATDRIALLEDALDICKEVLVVLANCLKQDPELVKSITDIIEQLNKR